MTEADPNDPFKGLVTDKGWITREEPSWWEDHPVMTALLVAQWAAIIVLYVLYFLGGVNHQ